MSHTLQYFVMDNYSKHTVGVLDSMGREAAALYNACCFTAGKQWDIERIRLEHYDFIGVLADFRRMHNFTLPSSFDDSIVTQFMKKYQHAPFPARKKEKSNIMFWTRDVGDYSVVADKTLCLPCGKMLSTYHSLPRSQKTYSVGFVRKSGKWVLALGVPEQKTEKRPVPKLSEEELKALILG